MRISRITVGCAVAAALAMTLTGCSSGGGANAGTDKSAAPAADCKPVSTFTTMKPGVIQAAGMNEMPGFLGVTNDGPFKGLNADLLPMFAEDNCLTIEWTPSTGGAATLALTDRKIDMFVGIVIKTEARGKIFGQMQGSMFYETAGVLSKDGIDSVEKLQGHKVGAVSGSTYIEPLKAAVGEKNLTQYQSSDAAYKDLAAGRIDAVVTPSIPQGWYVKENADKGLVSKLIQHDEKYPDLTQQYDVDWPYLKDNPELGAALDTFFDRVKSDGTLKDVLAKYGITDPFYFDGR